MQCSLGRLGLALLLRCCLELCLEARSQGCLGCRMGCLGSTMRFIQAFYSGRRWRWHGSHVDSGKEIGPKGLVVVIRDGSGDLLFFPRRRRGSMFFAHMPYQALALGVRSRAVGALKGAAAMGR